MPFYDRVIGRDDAGQAVPNPLYGHLPQALIVQFERGRITGAQAQSIIGAMSGAPLDAAGVTELNALLATITGSATNRITRALDIFAALELGQLNAPGYATPTELRTKLGL